MHQKRSVKELLLLILVVCIHVNIQAQTCPFPNFDDVVTFCTDENEYGISYPAGVGETYAFPGEVGCLATSPSPQWFIMQIKDPGMLAITIAHSEDEDIDFACYGPFTGINKNEVLNYICDNPEILNIESDYEDIWNDDWDDWYDDDWDDWYDDDWDDWYDDDWEDDWNALSPRNEPDYDDIDTCYGQEYIDEYNRVAAIYDSLYYYCENIYYDNKLNFIYPIDSVYSWADYKFDSMGVKYPLDPTIFDIDNPCFRGLKDNYPKEMMVDCSYSSSCKELCYIPDAQKDEWYLLLITNYSQKPGTISFNQTDGSANTNCNIIVDANATGPFCEGEPFELNVNNAPADASFSWRGPNGFSSTMKNPVIPHATIEDSGIYSVVMVANGKASEEVEIPVTIYKKQEVAITKDIEEGTYYMFGDEKLTVSGEYKKTFTSEVTDCDSIVTLTLNVFPKDTLIITQNGPICEGDNIVITTDVAPDNATFLWKGPNGFSSTDQNVSISNATKENAGTYSLTATANGKQLTAETEITIHSITTTQLTESIWSDESYMFGTEKLTEAGTYTHTLQSSTGCDSIVTLTLIVKEKTEVTISNNGPVCEGEIITFNVVTAPENATYNWSGPNGFTSSNKNPSISNVTTDHAGTYYLTVSVDGKDFPTAETEVIVINKKTENISITIQEGDSYSFGEQKLTIAGVYQNTFTSSTGCDSIVTLTLTVEELSPITISNNGPLCEGESLTFNVVDAPQNAEYKWEGPNGFSSSVSNPTISNVTTDNAGTYYLTVSVDGKDFPTAETEVIVINKKTENISITIQEGDSYSFGEQKLTIAGVYQNTFTSSTGCDSIVTLTLTVEELSPITISNNGPLCEGESLTFNVVDAPQNAEYKWEGPNGFSSSVSNPTISNVTTDNAGTYTLTVSANGKSYPTAETKVVINAKKTNNVTAYIKEQETYPFGGKQLTVSGTYQDTLTSVTGCDSIVILSLTVLTKDTLIISNNGPICQNDALQLIIINTPENATYAWTGPNGFTSTEKSPSIQDAIPENAGSYTLTAIADGKEYQAKTEVIIYPNQDVQLFDTIMSNETYLFNQQTLKESGIYTQTLKSVTGCDSIVTLNLTVKEIPVVSASNNGPLCEGETLLLDIENAPEGAEFQWKGPNGFTSTEQNPSINDITVANSGTYTVKYELGGESYSVPSTQVIVYKAKKQTISIHLKGEETYQIGDEEYSDPGEYIVTLTGSNGCDSIVKLKLTRAYVPKPELVPDEIFTPNSDGVHDRWLIQNIEYYTKVIIRIYDRYGKLIKQYNEYDNNESSWDGKDANGRNLPSTDYWYVIEVPEADKEYVGHVTLIR
ncbi:MAG: T9SS type B sorting domain-containing protein [Paludibacteraceae bacterium]|nr:T9SS type B sorting domain-containing protein [Paludibacteraceae bacterium]